MNMTIIEKISPENVKSLSAVYREVFSGSPWYEERICSGAKAGGKDKCLVQYTSRKLPENYGWKLDRAKRLGVVGNAAALEKCIICGKRLIDFYPEYVNQDELIADALAREGFIGFILRDTKSPIGFSWGYRVPKDRTTSVNFPLIRPMLEEEGINPERAFYGAELGIVEGNQGRRLGLAISAARLNEANSCKYENFVLRTKNEKVIAIARRVFSGELPKRLFDDPERGSPWYAWEFRDFDGEVLKLIGSSQ